MAIRENKNTYAIVFITFGILTSIFPFRGFWGLFTEATNAEMGLVATIWIATGIILYFIPNEKKD